MVSCSWKLAGEVCCSSRRINFVSVTTRQLPLRVIEMSIYTYLGIEYRSIRRLCSRIRWCIAQIPFDRVLLLTSGVLKCCLFDRLRMSRYFLPFIFPPFIVPRMNNISSVREFDTRLCKLDTVQTAQCHVRCRVTRIFLYTLEQGITRFKFSNSKRVMLIGLIRNAGWSKESVTGCRRSETRGILFLLLFDHVHACTDRQFVRTVILFHFHSSLFLKKRKRYLSMRLVASTNSLRSVFPLLFNSSVDRGE